MPDSQINNRDTGWIAYDNPLEVMPVNDLKDHDFGEKCWCKPFYEEEGTLIHNSADGRENYEPDNRLRKKTS